MADTSVIKTNGNHVMAQTPTFGELFKDIAKEPFDKNICEKLQSKINDDDVEIRPDGIIYLPEIKYRRILNNAFGVGAWSVLPKGDMIDEKENRVYYRGALFILGRYHAESTGEQKYIANNPLMTYATALEGAKSDCITRCCKDLGVASELWDPQFIKAWIAEHTIAVWCQNEKDKKWKKLWRKKSDPAINGWPWVEKTKKGQSEKKTTKPKQQTKSKTELKNQNGDGQNGEIDTDLDKKISALIDTVNNLHDKKLFDTKARDTWLSNIEGITNHKKADALFKTLSGLEKK